MPSRAPHAALRHLVSRYQGYRYRLDPRAVHFGLPSPHATLIVSFEDPIDVGWLDRPPQAHFAMLSGLHTAPAIIHTHGVQHGIQADLTPLGVRRLAGLPIGALRDEVVSMSEISAFTAADHDWIAAASTWTDRFDRLDAALVRLMGNSQPRAETAEAWRLLTTTRGNIPIADVASTVGWSRRQLTARFTEEFGLAPKQAARVIRFDRARRMAGTGLGLAEVAARCGYADQAHLSRDWRGFAGRTASDTLAEVFPILQDTHVPG